MYKILATRWGGRFGFAEAFVKGLNGAELVFETRELAQEYMDKHCVSSSSNVSYQLYPA